MGIHERKEREKSKMRKIILDTANKLFIEKGFESTSIRNIAGMIEYSPATIYLYFHDKNEILFHLQERAFENFTEKLNEFSFMKDHFSRLKKMSVLYIEFAAKNPAQYELLFYNNPYESTNPELVAPRTKILNLLKDQINTTIYNNQFTRMPIDEAVTMVWSFLHGLSSFSMRNQLTYVPQDEYNDHVGTLINRFYSHLKGSY
jgi:AcrR family transcriptional regulator